MSENNTQDLNETFEVTMDDAAVITVPIDATLSNSNEAADAKAVGDALALKADASSVNDIDVNGCEADNQGHISLYGTDIEMSSTDSTKLKAAIETAVGRTAADIPMSSDVSAQKISEKIADLDAKNATTIYMSEDSSAMSISEKIAATDATVTGLGTNLDGLAADAVKKSTDLVDNLTTANSQKALTANQGKVLMDMLSNLEVAITRNTTGWTRNYTRVYKIGRLVVVEVYTTGEVTANTTIATGLPIPLGSTAPVAMCNGSTAAVNPSTGVLYISAAGTNTITGGALVYESET